MPRTFDLILTGAAPAIWGSTYLVTTELLPQGYPLTVAMLRALPAGLLLLGFVKTLPHGHWWPRVFVLGALNFSFFWAFLFVAAYRLPGGVAAVLGAVQPLFVIFFARALLRKAILPLSVVAALTGICGVALLVLTPQADFDSLGIAAGLGGALSMAAGTVLSRKWQPPVSQLTFTAWQLTAGGLLLLPFALWFEPALPTLTATNILGLTYLGLIGAALTYFLWFRGLSRIDTSAVSALGFLSPVTAVLLGWLVLDQYLDLLQQIGVIVVLTSVWLGQRATQAKPSRSETSFANTKEMKL